MLKSGTQSKEALGKALPATAIVLLLVGFLVLKLLFLGPQIGDQGVYQYAAWLWSQGVFPHHDFFLSHPPMHLLAPVIAIGIAGKNLAILDMLPSFIGIGSGLLLFYIVRKQMSDGAGLIATAFFLFSYAHLVSSAHITGVEVAVFTTLLSLFFYERKNTILTGIVLGFTFFSGAYTAPFIGALLLISFLEEKHSFWKILGVFVLSSILLHGICIAIFGWEFMEQVYFYHFAKSGESVFFAPKASVVSLFAKKNALLLFLTFLGIPSFFITLRTWRRGEGDESPSALRLMRLTLVILGVYALFFFVAQSIFTHYFLLIVPFAAIAATFFLFSVQKLGDKKFWSYSLLPLSVLLILHLSLGIRGFIMNREQKSFDGLEEIKTYVSSTLRGEGTIYGDFAIVPTIALLSGGRIAANEIDTSIMRFSSDPSSLQSVFNALEEDHIQLIISRPRRGIVIFPPFREYLEKNYTLVKKFNGEGTEKEIWVWQKK